MVIILAICALAGGYFFLRYFNRIDRSLFDSTDTDYEPFGMIVVAVSGFAGALAAGGTFIEEIGHFGWRIQSVYLMAIHIGAICLAYSVYEAVTRMHSAGAVFGKTVFLWIACCIGGVIGALGSVVMICVLIIVAVLYILSAVLSDSGGKGKRWRADDGTVIEESKGLFGESYYNGNDGKSYDKTGDREFTEK